MNLAGLTPNTAITDGLVSTPAAIVGFRDRSPANWEIKPVPETTEGITAYNIKSLETFEGTIAEFNENLRG